MTSRDHQDEEVLRELYVEEGLTQVEIAERLGCSDSTVSNYIRKYDIEKEQPEWRDEDVLRELYWDEELSIGEVAERLDTSRDVIHRWMVRLDIDRRPGPQADRPWHDKELLRRMYFDREMSQADIAEEFDTVSCVISDWFIRHNIETPSYAEAGQIARRVNRAFFYTDKSGYELAGSRVGENTYSVPIHRLVAVAEEGYDSVAGDVVHHENEIPWDNRPSNLTVMDELEHRNMHVRGENDPYEGESVR